MGIGQRLGAARLLVAALTFTAVGGLVIPDLAASAGGPPDARGGSASPSTAPHADLIAAALKHGRVFEENRQSGTVGWKSKELSNGTGTLDSEPAAAGNPKLVALGTASSGHADAGAAAAPAPAVWTDTTIRGYADQVSVNHGGTITFFVSTAQPSYTLDVYRMGWYGGSGARLITSAGRLPGQNQAVPTPDPTTGMIAAGWQPSYTLNTTSTWTSGVYLAKLTAANGAVGYIEFVVRDDTSTAGIVYQLPVTTYEAYNNWGGKSLYDFSSTQSLPAVKVSFDRPYTAWAGAGSFFDGDYNMIRWLESQGYDVTYTTSVDIDQNPAQLTGHQVFLSPWHDEYWSKAMRDNVTAARDRGMNLAWLDANNVYWQIRFENSARGAVDRVITCYKDPTVDPMATTNPLLTTNTWRDPPVNLPENQLVGVMYQSNFAYGTSFPWVVANSANWVYAHTGLTDGAQIPGLVGYEFDQVFNNGLTPSGLVTLSASPVTDGAGVPGTQNAAVYTAPSGAIVFSAGTIYWSWKLDDNDYQHHGADVRVQQMTANVLNKMLNAAPTPPPPARLTEVVYGDALASGWSNSSWGATVNLANTKPVLAGNDSVAYTVKSAWGGFYLRSTTPMSTVGHTALSFAAQGTKAGQRYSVAVYSAAGQLLGRSVVLTNYGGDPPVGTWATYTVPFDADNLNMAGQPISGILIQDYSGKAQPALYLDNLGLADAAVVAPTTPVYTDSLAAGWTDASWSATVNYANLNPVLAGTDSLAFTVTAPWGGFYVRSATPVSTVGDSALTFAAEATKIGQRYSVAVYGAAGQLLGQPVVLTGYGGDPPVGAWNVYSIPLGPADLGVAGQAISGILIQDYTGAAQPALYVDNLGLK